ncbi:hypothetical protein [Roseimaritima multifibrata]|uniref:hypothetical protein n=1 Tax=Roseimaritima multifibrata TaxID=1930274 RepID=UPI001C54FBB3|nr:hypothetical protein [Roseimaritima multifibrata]
MIQLSDITFCVNTIHRIVVLPSSCHRLVKSLHQPIANPNIIVVNDRPWHVGFAKGHHA